MDPIDRSDEEDAAQRLKATEEQAAAMREARMVLPIPDVGQRLHAVITQIGEETTFVDYGGRSEALIETRHLRGPDGAVLAQPGEKIEAYVIANEEGVVLAPAMTLPPNESLPVLREAHLSAVPVTGKVTGVNAGGLEVDLSGNRAFCPASQIDVAHTADPSGFVGQTLDFRILEFGDMGRRIVVSRRALLIQRRDEQAARLKETLHEGDEVDGTVVRMEAFGAFVDLGGIDGMVHVSEIGHDRVNHPSEAVKIGEKVRVRIIEIGKDSKGRDRISLSIKAALQDPWADIPEEVSEGKRITGRVVRMADFGAFVRLAPGLEGLLHTTEIRNEPTSHPREVLKEGEEVEVRILKIDPSRRRLSLSMRDPDLAGGGGSRRGTPIVGETYDGVVRAHKPYGIFIDLPVLGERMSGLLPLEETGAPRGSDLSKRFPAGVKIDVTIRQIDEKGRIRLGIPAGVPQRQPQARGTQPPHGHGGGPGAPQGQPAPAPRATTGAMADALRRALEGK
jgi:small subunit ribosomal protein S1